MSGLTRRAVALAFSLAIGLPVALAQDAQDSGDAPTAKKIDKTTKRKMKQTLKELDNAYKQWLQEDVVYIITPDERNAFLQLQTNEEREQFIEQFWLRRSSNPDLPDNDFKEEHYRRIAYANEHYASGIPGWKTDRGRMYIMWGPADEVESHPTGGTYDRPMEEGGGSTSTYPWETWRWRYLEGIGENIILDRKSTRLNSSHGYISYAVFCLKKKKKTRVRSRAIAQGPNSSVSIRSRPLLPRAATHPRSFKHLVPACLPCPVHVRMYLALLLT